MKLIFPKKTWVQLRREELDKLKLQYLIDYKQGSIYWESWKLCWRLQKKIPGMRNRYFRRY